MLYQQQQQRLYQEVREEKERVAESARRQRAEVDALQRKLEDTHANLMASVRNEYDTSKAEQDKQHEVMCYNKLVMCVLLMTFSVTVCILFVSFFCFNQFYLCCHLTNKVVHVRNCLCCYYCY